MRLPFPDETWIARSSMLVLSLHTLIRHRRFWLKKLGVCAEKHPGDVKTQNEENEMKLRCFNFELTV